MKIEAEAKQLTIFVNSTDQWHLQPLYVAIVARCREKNIAGVSVTRCIEGYGASRELHTERLEPLMDHIRVRIDIVDLPERIEPLLADLEKMIPEGLITISAVRVQRFLIDPNPT